MICVVYASTAVQWFRPEELEMILQVSRTNNQRDGISGMLLYKEGCIIQALEGPKEKVSATHARILRDPRHHQVITMLNTPITERQFAGWSMGSPDLKRASEANHPEINAFLSTQSPAEDYAAPGKALKLLTTFREVMR